MEASFLLQNTNYSDYQDSRFYMYLLFSFLIIIIIIVIILVMFKGAVSRLSILFC